MADIIKMPRLSDTMTEGVIAAWHKQVGDSISSGDLLAEIETDKATMDLESFYDGTVLFIGVDEGKGIPVGDLLAIIGKEGEDISGLIKDAQSGASVEAETVSETVVETTHATATQPAASSQATSVATPPQPSVAPVPVHSDHFDSDGSAAGDKRIKTSPLARAIAKERGIDLNQVKGTGDNGRIIKRDIENYVEAPKPAAAPTTVPQAATSISTAQESFREERVSQMRKAISRRVSESKFSAPHFYLTMEVNMDKAVQTRKALNEVSPSKISFNDFIIKACAAALKQHPYINASWQGEVIRFNDHINIGVAVAIDDGLIIPVIRYADTKGLSTIAAEVKDLAGKARDRKLQPPDWEGSTFTVSNLGMFGIDEFTAIINPPDSCILAVGAIVDKPIVKDGEIVPGKMMKMTLSCDHRVVDGALGAAFLKTCRELLEDPIRFLL